MRMRTIFTHTCKHCGMQYGTSKKESKYCSRKCSNAINNSTRNLHPSLGAVKRTDDWWKTFGTTQ